MGTRRKNEVPAELQVVVLGEVSDKLVEHARQKVAWVTHYLRDPVGYARVTLLLEPDPARERPASAQAMIDVNGQPVRAHAVGVDMREAINRLEERLRRKLESLTQHREQRRKRGPGAREEHEWRHGDPPTHRPPYYPRPVEQRQVLARSVPASRPMFPEEAADEMELLDYSFHLFMDVRTDEDTVAWRNSHGTVSWTALTDAPVVAQPEAITMLDVTREPFVFYREAVSGRGAVLYHRYDGHYGLLKLHTPREETRS